jgi:hypothetical protein
MADRPISRGIYRKSGFHCTPEARTFGNKPSLKSLMGAGANGRSVAKSARTAGKVDFTNVSAALQVSGRLVRLGGDEGVARENEGVDGGDELIAGEGGGLDVDAKLVSAKVGAPTGRVAASRAKVDGSIRPAGVT